MLPPSWMTGGTAKYLLGTDEQGRDVLSALMYGARISLFVGAASVLLSLLIGVSARAASRATSAAASTRSSCASAT